MDIFRVDLGFTPHTDGKKVMQHKIQTNKMIITQLLQCGVLLVKTFAQPDNVNKLKCQEIHRENFALELQHFLEDLRTQRALQS